VAAHDLALLILRDDQPRGRLVRLIEVAPGTFVFPLRWLVSGRLRQGQLLDATLSMYHVERVMIAGIAGPDLLGAPVFAYILLLAFGWFTLSIPVKVHLRLSEPQVLSLDEAKDFLDQIISKSQMNPSILARLRQQIRRSRSLDDMARAVAQTRE
jgi:hypothetical protein